MKALEKAAQDREKSPAAQSAVHNNSASELSLEALEPSVTAGASEDISRVPVGGNRMEIRARISGNPASRHERTRSHEQIRAANVLSAHSSEGAGAITWLRAHPLFTFGGLAGMFLMGYAAYVYVQIAHPGLMTPSPPQPLAAAPAVPPSANNRSPINTSGTATPHGESDRALSTSAPEPGSSQFVPMKSVFASPADVVSHVTQSAPEMPKANSGSAVIPPATATVRASLTGVAAATPAVSALPPPAPPSRIAVSRGDTAVPRVNATVSEAYAALEAGQYDSAQRLYGQVLRSEPANVDALLGLAAIAQKDNRLDDAQRYFAAILDVEPRNALAQSGLIGLMSRADPHAAESRLKQLLAREPSPPLYFNLGNLYAEQGLWPQAQQAYFQAHTMEPRNPDYAYNLAIGLEHLNQQKLALGFYRKALQLATVKGTANFDSARIQDRITQLSAQFD